MSVIALAACTVCSALLVMLAARPIWRVLNGSGPIGLSLRLVLIFAAALFAAGVWWGWPGGAWAPDELQLADLFDGIAQRFSNGWFHRYPPFHFYVLTAFDAPFFVADRLHLFDRTASNVRDWMFLLNRLLSVVMGVGVVAAIGALAREVAGQRYAWTAALCGALFMPFVYYAKTTNLDVPCLFWTSLAFVFFARAGSRGDWRDGARFGVTAALAIATKDQVAALFVLPVAALIYRVVRGRVAGRTMVAAGSAAMITLVVAYNLIFNAAGVVDRIARLQAVVGPGGGHAFRMFPPTLAGQWALATATAKQGLLMLGAGGVLFVGCGAGAIARGIAPRLPGWFALAGASYYLGLIVPIGFIYDRFLLPLLPLAAIPAGIGLHGLLDVSGPSVLRRFARVVAVVFGIALAWRAVSVDAMLITDSRLGAERWLRTNTAVTDLVATIGEPQYLPRFLVHHQSIAPDVAAVRQWQPFVVVVNMDDLQRFQGRIDVEAFLHSLGSDAGYREVYRSKTRLWWSALNWDSRFTDGRGDEFTNLNKANPELVIFARPR